MKDNGGALQSNWDAESVQEGIGHSLLEIVPILKELGVSVLEVTPTCTTLELRINDSNVGPYGAVLGAALMAGADMAACIAAVASWRSNGDREVGGFATQEFSSSFCRSARIGPVLIKAEPQYSSTRRAVVNFEARDLGRDNTIALAGVATIVRL